MDTGQMLWGINTLLLAVLGFFVKNWMATLTKELDKMDKRISTKLAKAICVERNSSVKCECAKMRNHRHAPVTGERGGEVIIL